MATSANKPGLPSREIPDAPNQMRQIRLKKGLTLRAFARLLNVSATSLSRHEMRNVELGEDTIFRAAEILGVDPRLLDRKMRLRSEKLDALTAQIVSQNP